MTHKLNLSTLFNNWPQYKVSKIVHVCSYDLFQPNTKIISKMADVIMCRILIIEEDVQLRHSIAQN